MLSATVGKVEKSALNKTAVLYTVTPTDKRDELKVELSGKISVGDYTNLTSVVVDGKPVLLGYNPQCDHLDLFEVAVDDRSLIPIAAKPVVGAGQSNMIPFTLGNQPYISMYSGSSGVFELYAIHHDYSLSNPVLFYRIHEPAISKNFTVVKSFTQIGQVVFLGYDMATGYVALYTVSVTPVSAVAGQPPLRMQPAWSHPWAPGWTRFAFFQFGGENYFFKINIANPDKVNVNIDHVLDTLSSGTIEVGSHLPLSEAMDLTSVEPFALGDGNPYFVGYIAKSGTMILNRFHSDCMGWTTAAKFDGPVGAEIAFPLVLAKDKVLLVCV
jgi:hypothetical protein